MDANFTSLIRTFLASDNILDRITISHTIFELLETSLKHCKSIDSNMQEHFIHCVKVCSLNPNSLQRSEIIEIANIIEKKSPGLSGLNSVA